MVLLDHFHPPLSQRRHWHAFHNAWATYIASDLNQRLPQGYFAEPNVQFGIEIEAVEISIFNSEAGPILAGAIELVSPANKDRPKHQDAFVAKCQTYLQQGIGLVVVDVVTSRNANLHDALMAKIGTIAPQTSRVNAGSKRDIGLYAVAYRVVERSNQSSLDIWLENFSIGEKLPTLPLWLRGELCLPVELNATYDRTCREQRIVLDQASRLG